MNVEKLIWRIWASLLLFCYLMCSCRTEYVPLEVVSYDSLMIEKLMKDSVFVRDSVYLQEKGDTVFKNKDKYVYVYKLRVDTFYVYKVREVEVPVPVERELSWWEEIKLEYTEIVISVLVAIALINAIRAWIVKKVRKK